MTYRIRGLDPTPYQPLFGLPDDELAARGIVRMAVTGPGFPCRISLTDRVAGETVLLLNHVSHSGGPYQASHAIFVTEGAAEAADYIDEAPPVFAMRILSLRGFDADGMMVEAQLTQPGEADAAIRAMLADFTIGHIDAHNAVRGCFSARIERN